MHPDRVEWRGLKKRGLYSVSGLTEALHYDSYFLGGVKRPDNRDANIGRRLEVVNVKIEVERKIQIKMTSFLFIATEENDRNQGKMFRNVTSTIYYTAR